MAGVFAILRGCSKGTEEQEIARAMNVLRGGNPGGFLSELSEREEWQAQREVVMASLVQRAFLAPDGQWGGNDEVEVSSRRLQVREFGTFSKTRCFQMYLFPKYTAFSKVPFSKASCFQMYLFRNTPCFFKCTLSRCMEILNVPFPGATVFKCAVLLNTRLCSEALQSKAVVFSGLAQFR